MLQGKLHLLQKKKKKIKYEHARFWGKINWKCFIFSLPVALICLKSCFYVHIRMIIPTTRKVRAWEGLWHGCTLWQYQHNFHNWCFMLVLWTVRLNYGVTWKVQDLAFTMIHGEKAWRSKINTMEALCIMWKLSVRVLTKMKNGIKT